jgi:hypothetical protein
MEKVVPGSTSEDELLKVLAQQNLVPTIRPIFASRPEYIVVRADYFRFGANANTRFWIDSGLVYDIALGPTMVCAELAFEALGTPSGWSRNESGYELYFANHKMVLYVREATPMNISSFRLTNDENFKMFSETSDPQPWNAEAAAIFAGCAP